MTIIVLVAVGFLACTFLLFVVFQWTRDTRRESTTVDDAAGGTTEKKKRLQVVGSWRAPEKHDRFSGRSRVRRRSRVCGPRCNECERVVYERVVNSLKQGKRS